MARLPRLIVPGRMHYVSQRCHDMLELFRDSDDFQHMRTWILEASRQFHVRIFSYVLLAEGIRMLVEPSDHEGLARMMQWVGRHYVPYFNRKYGRTGSLWQGRFHTTLIEPERYFTLCSRYIEAAPVRSRLVNQVGDYPWSSYAHHAGVRSDPILSDPVSYWAMGNTPFEREANYVACMEQALTSVEEEALEHGLCRSWVLGGAAFVAEIEHSTQRRTQPLRRGRPRKRSSDQDLSLDTATTAEGVGHETSVTIDSAGRGYLSDQTGTEMPHYSVPN